MSFICCYCLSYLGESGRAGVLMCPTCCVGKRGALTVGCPELEEPDFLLKAEVSDKWATASSVSRHPPHVEIAPLRSHWNYTPTIPIQGRNPICVSLCVHNQILPNNEQQQCDD